MRRSNFRTIAQKNLIEYLICSNLPHHKIELIRKILEQPEQNNKSIERCDSPSLLKELENSILSELDNNHKSLEDNNQQILIQIPKNLKVSSIQIQFEQEMVQHRANPLASML